MAFVNQKNMNENSVAIRHRQSGLSLIELLVAIGLGIFFSSVALTFVVGSGTAATTQDVESRIQENARFATDEIVAMARMAGYYNPTLATSIVPNGQFYHGACGAFNPCTADGGGAEPDRVAVLINPPPDDGTDQDCTGNVIDANAATAASAVIANVYFIAADENGLNSLQCQAFMIDASNNATATGGAQVLVSGVDNMQIQYGVSNIQVDGELDTQTVGYLNAADVTARVVPAGVSSPWLDIKSLQFAFLLNSGLDDETSDQTSQTYSILDADDDVYNDSLLRQLVSGTVVINNARS